MATTPVFKIVSPLTPELLPEVQDVLARHLLSKERAKVLEFGSGYSTLWFSRMARVRSIEHDPNWYAEVCGAIDAYGRGRNRTSVVFQPDVAEIPNHCGKGLYDVVLVDGVDEARVPFGLRAVENVKVGGLFVVDDSHWELLKPLKEVMNDPRFEYYDYRNGYHTRKTGEEMYHETTIYRRMR